MGGLGFEAVGESVVLQAGRREGSGVGEKVTKEVGHLPANCSQGLRTHPQGQLRFAWSHRAENGV